MSTKLEQYIATTFKADLEEKESVELDVKKVALICGFVLQQCQELGGYFNIREASLLNDALILLTEGAESSKLQTKITEADAYSLLVQGLNVVQEKGRLFQLQDTPQILKIVVFLSDKIQKLNSKGKEKVTEVKDDDE